MTKLSPTIATYVGLLVLLSAMAKSALIPFSGWLPRAMEGPTPSARYFIAPLGSLRGVFAFAQLVSPLLDASPILWIFVVVIGLGTAIFAAFIGRVPLTSNVLCRLRRLRRSV